ncbi:MAG: tRNA pseudouridine(55) synthase TruB [Kiritimatiellia bacterium]
MKKTKTMNDKKPAPPRPTDPWDGILPVDKPAGLTSHDVVHRIRRKFGFRKVGHGGTLDPSATGLLVILVGRGTKLSSRFLSSDKAYRGTMKLGVSTATHDAEGEIVGEKDCSRVTSALMTKAMEEFQGDVFQTPPMISAIKVDGVPLYKRARRGETVERRPRLIHVYEFTLTDFHLPRAGFFLRCTKGTYVRTLCADVGERLGCGAFLERLERTACGDLKLDDAIGLDQILAMPLDEVIANITPAAFFNP